MGLFVFKEEMCVCCSSRQCTCEKENTNPKTTSELGDSDVTLNCAEWSGMISPSCDSHPTSLTNAAVSAKLKKALSDDFSFLKIFFMFVCGT